MFPFALLAAVTYEGGVRQPKASNQCGIYFDGLIGTRASLTFTEVEFATQNFNVRRLSHLPLKPYQIPGNPRATSLGTNSIEVEGISQVRGQNGEERQQY
jgi:hypothetical protein